MINDEQAGKPQGIEANQGGSPITQSDALGFGELQALDQIVRPYFEGHWKNQLEKSKLEIEFRLRVMRTESRHRGWLLVGTFAVVFSVILLAFYLFWTERDEYAMEIIIGIVLVVTSSVAGYGWRAVKRLSTSNDE